jgi:AraC-like DNA-binding protein
MWRAPDTDGVLLMAGWTDRYAVQPRGDYVFGLVDGAPMRSRRGGESRVVAPGQLVAWDPSAGHAGTAHAGRPWFGRVLVVAAADLAALAGDPDTAVPTDVVFAEPVVSDPRLARAFRRMHRVFEVPGPRLGRDELLACWLRAMLERTVQRPIRPPPDRGDERAVRLAYDYLAEHVDRNVGLDELAAVAGIGKFRLVRAFRQRVGRPPHAVALAHRIRRARRLLEAGVPVAEIAALTGFADQSHLHRHFRPSLGLSPGEYRRRFRPQV